MDRGAWRATVCGVAKSRTRLSDEVCMHAPATCGSAALFAEQAPIL